MKATSRQKVIAVMPAYNAARTLKKTIDDIPSGVIDKIILVDDSSRDRTVEVAHQLHIEVVKHPQNRGYGGNQKNVLYHGTFGKRRRDCNDPPRLPI